MFAPSVYEVMLAKKYFLEEYKRHRVSMTLPKSNPAYMSQEIAISCAAANVWKHARQYQKEKTRQKGDRVLNEIMNIQGVECYEKNGVAYLKLETVARGLGFTERKGKKEYVMWRRVDNYLQELDFGTSAENKFIPENIFYRLAMKAINETAERFQALVADEIIPSIRKHGAYMTPEILEPAILDLL